MKTIHFPGNYGQRCQARYAIASRNTNTICRTTILFAADEKCPGKTLPNLGDSPAYLLTKVLCQELTGCRLDLVDVFYLGWPDERQQRELYRWSFKPVPQAKPHAAWLSEFLGISNQASLRAKAWMLRPISTALAVFSAYGPCADSFPILVDDEQHLVSKDERQVIFDLFDKDLRSLPFIQEGAIA